MRPSLQDVDPLPMHIGGPIDVDDLRMRQMLAILQAEVADIKTSVAALTEPWSTPTPGACGSGTAAVLYGAGIGGKPVHDPRPAAPVSDVVRWIRLEYRSPESQGASPGATADPSPVVVSCEGWESRELLSLLQAMEAGT